MSTQPARCGGCSSSFGKLSRRVQKCGYCQNAFCGECLSYRIEKKGKTPPTHKSNPSTGGNSSHSNTTNNSDAKERVCSNCFQDNAKILVRIKTHSDNGDVSMSMLCTPKSTVEKLRQKLHGRTMIFKGARSTEVENHEVVIGEGPAVIGYFLFEGKRVASESQCLFDFIWKDDTPLEFEFIVADLEESRRSFKAPSLVSCHVQDCINVGHLVFEGYCVKHRPLSQSPSQSSRGCIVEGCRHIAFPGKNGACMLHHRKGRMSEAQPSKGHIQQGSSLDMQQQPLTDHQAHPTLVLREEEHGEEEEEEERSPLPLQAGDLHLKQDVNLHVEDLPMQTEQIKPVDRHVSSTGLLEVFVVISNDQDHDADSTTLSRDGRLTLSSKNAERLFKSGTLVGESAVKDSKAPSMALLKLTKQGTLRLDQLSDFRVQEEEGSVKSSSDNVSQDLGDVASEKKPAAEEQRASIKTTKGSAQGEDREATKSTEVSEEAAQVQQGNSHTKSEELDDSSAAQEDGNGKLLNSPGYQSLVEESAFRLSLVAFELPETGFIIHFHGTKPKEFVVTNVTLNVLGGDFWEALMSKDVNPQWSTRTGVKVLKNKLPMKLAEEHIQLSDFKPGSTLFQSRVSFGVDGKGVWQKITRTRILRRLGRLADPDVGRNPEIHIELRSGAVLLVKITTTPQSLIDSLA